jgi:pimeloyl-ACP methyl ester carboxylesterase
MRIKARTLACAASIALASCAQHERAHHGEHHAGTQQHHHGAYTPVAKQGYFFTGGEYRPAKDGNVMVGQMFVQYQIPHHRTSKYPIVMIHGGGQSGTNFLGTPDDRPGWADYFLKRGYPVYVVDAPARARSAGSVEVLGAPSRRAAQWVSDRFTAPERKPLYPQAAKHSQWPGTGVPGDPVFDQFYASQVEQLEDPGVGERLIREAGAKLLDRIGPAILLGHSQGGPLVFTIADARPKLTKAVLAIEPNGPPFAEVAYAGGSAWYKDGPLSRPWGITRNPLTYEPAVAKPPQSALEAQADGPDFVQCRLQAEPARQLVNLRTLPTLVLVSEASYHAPYDHCTSKFLKQAGVEHTFTRLEQHGIRGNGHMMMLEKNSDEIAAFIERWIRENVR